MAAPKGAWVAKDGAPAPAGAKLPSEGWSGPAGPLHMNCKTQMEDGGCKMKMLTIPILTVLSKRQEEILQAACDGMPDKLIANQLGVSPRTLEGHWRAIHRKLGSVNRCQAGFIYAALRENPQGTVLA